MTSSALRRWLQASAAAGGAAWLVIALFSAGEVPWLGEYELLFLLAPLVTVPLALGLAASRFAGGPPRALVVACLAQPPAAWLAAAGFAFKPGGPASALTLPWLLVCLLVALSARDLLRLRWRSASQGIMHAGMLYLVIGGAALSLSRAGVSVLHVQEPIVLLTAVHFHFTGFATPMFAESLLKNFKATSRLAKHVAVLGAAAVALVAATPLLAVGWLLDSPAWKLLCVLAIIASLSALAACALRLAFATRSLLPGVLLTAAALSVLFAMVLAGLYAAGQFAGHSLVGLQPMARLHGTANGLGFSLCGLLGMSLWETRRLTAGNRKEGCVEPNIGRSDRAQGTAELVDRAGDRVAAGAQTV